MQGYRDLPDDFAKRYESIWVTPPNDELCDPEKVAKYLRWNIEELELADDLGFDGLGVNEHHQNGYGFCNSPNLIASILARRNSDAAIVVLGDTLPLHNPPIRVAEEFAMIDCLSGGRLVAGFPVGSPPDTVGNYGTPPTQVRPRYYEAHDLIMQAWTKPGPFPFNGEFTKLRYVNPWPKPLQKPHPPVWLAGGGSVETWKFAADNDYTYSYLSFSGHKAGKSMMDGYWAEIEKAGLDDNPYRAGFAQLVVVGATDAEAEKLYLKHLRNFYSKALHIPVYMNAVPGFMTKRSAEFALRQGAVRGAHKTILGDPRTASWKDFTESRMVIGGSPDTVAQQLEEAIRNLRIGHLMALFQIQSMDRELTEYSLRLFADKVLPKVRGIWAKEGYEDRWWPQGATRNSRRKAVAAAEAAL
jgi:alkanesulfonate monooxygenase SsuD/methylene tetrahydromethanopterin reductase-like flavin-dependent oxidoreductase (luciferase family)